MAQIKRYTFTVCDEYVDYGGCVGSFKKRAKGNWVRWPSPKIEAIFIEYDNGNLDEVQALDALRDFLKVPLPKNEEG